MDIMTGMPFPVEMGMVVVVVVVVIFLQLGLQTFWHCWLKMMSHFVLVLVTMPHCSSYTVTCTSLHTCRTADDKHNRTANITW
jgi:membrane protein required for beta-lactamase induction